MKPRATARLSSTGCQRRKDNMELKVADLQTLEHLREWVNERLNGSTVIVDDSGEVVIKTGCGIDLGNYLYPLGDDDE